MKEQGLATFSFSPMLFPLPKQVKAKLEESEWFKISSKRSVNPDSRTVFNMYTLFCKRFGSINDPDAYLKAAEFIEKLNEKAGEKIASIRQLDDETIVVAVSDELMKRTYTFVDATGSVDQ